MLEQMSNGFVHCAPNEDHIRIMVGMGPGLPVAVVVGRMSLIISAACSGWIMIDNVVYEVVPLSQA